MKNTKKSLKSLVLGLPLILGIGCATPQINRSFDASYVSSRDNKGSSNQIRTEINIDAEIPNKNNKLTVGVGIVDYINIDRREMIMDYILSGRYQIGNFEFYILRDFYQPWNDELPFITFDDIGKKDISDFILGEARIGAKIKW